MDEELQRYLHGVTGAVEASRYEHQMLYMEYAISAQRMHADVHGYEPSHEGRRRRLRWCENTSGHGRTVGHHGGEPVVISLRVDDVDLERILFYHATSNTVNYEMIEEWLDKNLPDTARKPDGRINRTDAMNFCGIFPYHEKIVLGYKEQVNG